jgi:hypothetical protein
MKQESNARKRHARTGHQRSGQMGQDLFIAKRLGGWDGDGVAGGQ